MSDWQAGDLALCVNNGSMGGLSPHGRRLLLGKTYKVVRITPPGGWACGFDGVGLVIDGPRNSGPDGDWHERRFVKVTPPAADEWDRETIALMNAAPAKVPAVAVRCAQPSQDTAP